MSQKKINDFFGVCKRQNSLKRKSSHLVDSSVNHPVKRITVENGKGCIRKDGLRDIRDLFSNVATCDQHSSEHQSLNSEQTLEGKIVGILNFDQNKRRKQCNAGDDISTETLPKIPYSDMKSARKRIFDISTDGNSVIQHDPILQIKEDAVNVEYLSNSKKFSSCESKLTFRDVKQRLSNCSTLPELKYRLAQINDCAEKLKEFKTKTSCSPLETIVEPAVTPKKESNKFILESPKKFLSANASPKKKTRGFEKYAYLAKKHENGLLLPFKFRTLLEMFRCVDFVISLLHNREEVCTFEKLKKSFEEMTRKKIDMLRLTQILNVFPESYKISYLKNTKCFSTTDSHQLVISPLNVNKMTPSVLLTRKETFQSKLLEIVKKHHQLFLSSLEPPVFVENGSLQRWHPNFKLEDIPDIEPIQTLIPTLPTTSTQTFEHCFRSHSDSCSENSTAETYEVNETKIECGILKGISSNLLEKIRAKEAKAVAREMVRKPENEKKIALLNRLPEMIKIIHNYFVCDGRGAIRVDEVLQKCVQSYHTFISSHEVKEHVTLLCDLFPEWIYFLNVRKGVFLKIDKTATIADLINRLDDKRSKMRHE